MTLLDIPVRTIDGDDATLAEHAGSLAAATGVRLGPSRVGRLLGGMGLTRKKRP